MTSSTANHTLFIAKPFDGIIDAWDVGAYLIRYNRYGAQVVDLATGDFLRDENGQPRFFTSRDIAEMYLMRNGYIF